MWDEEKSEGVTVGEFLQTNMSFCNELVFGGSVGKHSRNNTNIGGLPLDNVHLPLNTASETIEEAPLPITLGPLAPEICNK